MSFEHLYELVKRAAIRSRLVATMRELSRTFRCNIREVHEISRRDLSREELLDDDLPRQSR